MKQKSLDSYLRAHRKKAGLSQSELAKLLGYADEGAVRRHEKSKTLPPLLLALGYEAIFQTPISKLFSGLKETVENTIESRISLLEKDLKEKIGNRGRTSPITQKLAWISERKKMNDA